MTEEDLPNYGFERMVVNNGKSWKVIYSRCTGGETMTCEYTLKYVSHKLNQKEIGRTEFLEHVQQNPI